MSPGDLGLVAGLAALPPLAYLVWRRPGAGIAILLLGVAAPWEFEVGSPVSVTVWPVDLLSVVVVGVIFARAATIGDRRLSPVLAALLAGCLIASALATFEARDAVTSLGGLARFTQAFVLIPIAVYFGLADRRDQRLFLFTLIAAGAFQSAFAIVQFATETGASFTATAGETANRRGIGTFDASEIMALPTIVTAALIASVAIALWGTGRDRLVARTISPLLIAGLLISLSRGAWIAALVGVLVLLLAKSRRETLAWGTSGIVIIAAAALVLPAGNAIRERGDSLFDTASNPDASVQSRFRLWDAAIDIWADRPLTGVGIKGFAEHRESYASLEVFPGSDISDPGRGFRIQELESPHNLYLLILSEQGVIGMVAYGLLFAVTLLAGARALRSGGLAGAGGRYGPFAIAVLAWLASYLVRSLYADIGGPTVSFDGVLLGGAMALAFRAWPQPAGEPEQPDPGEAPLTGWPGGASMRELVTRGLHADVRVLSVVIGVLALLVRLPLLFGFDTATTADSELYVETAEKFLNGLGLDTEGVRPPGFPLFIAPLTLLPGSAIEAVVVIQHMLGAALAAAIFAVGDRYFGRIAGLLAGGTAVIAHPLANVEHLVLADWLFAAVVFAGTVALIEGTIRVTRGESERLTRSASFLVLSGACFGMATLVKPNGQALIIVAPLVLAFVMRSWRPTLRATGMVTAGMLVVVMPWIVHNWGKHGHPEVVFQGGTSLWLRVFDQDKLPIPDDSAQGLLANRLHERYLTEEPLPGLQDPASLDPDETTESYAFVFTTLTNRGWSVHEAGSFQTDVALAAIREHPFDYAEGTARNVRQYVEANSGFGHARLGRGQADSHAFSNETAVPISLATGAWDLGEILVVIQFALSLGLIACLALPFRGSAESRVAAAGFLVTWLVLALGGSMFNQVEARFSAQVAILQWMLQAAAVVLVTKALAQALAGRRWPTLRQLGRPR